MPDYLASGPQFDDDGLELPHLDIEDADKDGNRHHEYRAYKAREKRKDGLDEIKENIGSFKPKIEHHQIFEAGRFEDSDNLPDDPEQATDEEVVF